MENSYIYILFFQKNNIMRFKNRFHITPNGPLPAILRSFVRTPLIIVSTTLMSISLNFLFIHRKIQPHFLLPILRHGLHDPAKRKNMDWGTFGGVIRFGHYFDVILVQPFQRFFV
jgi:hypothetical protein